MTVHKNCHDIFKKRNETIIDIQLIQKLWNNYGTLNRVKTHDRSYILKLIQLPKSFTHPKGQNTQISHNRKVESYKVESFWYQDFSTHIQGVANLIDSGHTQNSQYLLLEDLAQKNLFTKTEISKEQIELTISWLARLHSQFLNQKQSNLWTIGTYWNLETRPCEYELIKDEKLKLHAHHFHKALNKSKFQTIVHGDAKLANFLYSQDEVYAVDFQYTGGGVGIKDFIYFLSSVYTSTELYQYAELNLEFYLKELVRFSKESEIEKVYRDLYPIAWADFYRFLSGWDSNHYKINDYIKEMTQKAYQCL